MIYLTVQQARRIETKISSVLLFLLFRHIINNELLIGLCPIV